MTDDVMRKILDLGNGSREKYYFSFAGGGAKGLVHVGTLQYIEGRDDIEICGVSGTSAGALIATLHAVGYKSDEIIAKDGSSQLFRDIKSTHFCKTEGLSDIDGIQGLFNQELFEAVKKLKSNNQTIFARLGHVTEFFKSPKVFINNSLLIIKSFLLASLVLCSVIARSFDNSIIGVFFATASAFSVLALLFIIFFWWAKLRGKNTLEETANKVVNGLSDIEIFRSIFSEIISKKFHGDSSKAVVFSDLPQLAVVATDIKTGEAVVFSANRGHGDIPVADALCSSMAIPGLFALQNLRGFDLYDGGMVSNLPSWVFDAEVKFHSRAKIIAINITSGAKIRNRHVESLQETSSIKRLLGASSLLANAVLSGSQRLHLRPGTGVREFSIETSLSTEDFDAGPVERIDAVDRGYAAVSQMMQICKYGPAAYSYFCDLIRQDALEQLQIIYDDLGIENTVRARDLRVSIAVPAYNRDDVIQLKFSAGFYSQVLGRWIPHSDVGLVLPKTRSVAGQAIMRGGPVFRSLTATKYGFLDGQEDHDVVNRVRRGVRWVLAIPFNAGDTSDTVPRYAVSIDGSGKLSDIGKYLKDSDESNDVFKFFSGTMAHKLELRFQKVSGMVKGIPSMEDCDDAHRI